MCINQVWMHMNWFKIIFINSHKLVIIKIEEIKTWLNQAIVLTVKGRVCMVLIKTVLM